MDARSDIYSIGVLLHELLTGRTPFSTDTLLQTSPTLLTERLEGDLDRIVMRCLEKNPARRYQTCHELELDLRRRIAWTRHAQMPARVPGVARRS